VPPADAQFAVISDIDDTVIHIDIASTFRMARSVFPGNAKFQGDQMQPTRLFPNPLPQCSGVDFSAQPDPSRGCCPGGERLLCQLG
jgi:hypothetical protein